MTIIRLLALGTLGVLAGCAPQPAAPPPPPPQAIKQVQPPDWFHQQLAAASAAKRAHRPKDDTAGARKAYDDVIRSACGRAALAGPGKYPARCDAVLRPAVSQPQVDSCADEGGDEAKQIECSD